MLCRLKILERKQERIKDIGFIDPYYNHEVTVQEKPHEVEENFLRALSKQHQFWENVVFLQLQVSVTFLYTFCFAYSKLINYLIDELCVRRFHFILLVIEVDVGIVRFMDSKRKDPQIWADMSAILQR